jgi:2-keto-3-deoxy-6-phosphogluconate aldolase
MKRFIFAAILAVGVFFSGSSAFAQGTHTITLTWPTSSSAGVTGYNVYKFFGACPAAGTAFTKITATPIIATTFSETGIADNVTRCYHVTAVAAAGESSPSGTIQITTPTFTPSAAVLLPPASVAIQAQ